MLLKLIRPVFTFPMWQLKNLKLHSASHFTSMGLDCAGIHIGISWGGLGHQTLLSQNRNKTKLVLA